jgi:hypothetical protein
MLQYCQSFQVYCRAAEQEFCVTPHHYPITLLHKKPGYRTKLIMKEEARFFKRTEGHCHLSEDMNSIRLIKKQLMDPKPAISDEQKSMYTRFRVEIDAYKDKFTG